LAQTLDRKGVGRWQSAGERNDFRPLSDFQNFTNRGARKLLRTLRECPRRHDSGGQADDAASLRPSKRRDQCQNDKGRGGTAAMEGRPRQRGKDALPTSRRPTGRPEEEVASLDVMAQ